jgi:anti-sigma factor RsiW
MNCRDLRRDITLHVEGDLPPRLIAGVETHLASCASCRTFASEVRETQAELRQVRNEIVDASSLLRVRSRVLTEVQTIDQRRTWLDRAAIWLWASFRWRYALLGCVGFVVFGTGFWYARHTRSPAGSFAGGVDVANTQLVQTPVVGAGFTLARPNEGSALRKATSRSPRRHKAGAYNAAVMPSAVAEVEREDVVVKIFTDDPDVIIYWLIDQKTGGF